MDTDSKGNRHRSWFKRKVLPHILRRWHLTQEVWDDHRNGAFVVLYAREDENLMCVGNAKYGWRLGSLSGGGIFPKETPLGTALRETGEEFGFGLDANQTVPWGIFAQKARRSDRDGNPLDDTLVDGLLTAFEAAIPAKLVIEFENDEIELQRLVPIWEIFEDGNAKYGISTLRLLAHYWNWRKDRTFRINNTMGEKVTTTVTLPSGEQKTYTF